MEVLSKIEALIDSMSKEEVVENLRNISYYIQSAAAMRKAMVEEEHSILDEEVE